MGIKEVNTQKGDRAMLLVVRVCKSLFPEAIITFDYKNNHGDVDVKVINSDGFLLPIEVKNYADFYISTDNFNKDYHHFSKYNVTCAYIRLGALLQEEHNKLCKQKNIHSFYTQHQLWGDKVDENKLFKEITKFLSKLYSDWKLNKNTRYCSRGILILSKFNLNSIVEYGKYRYSKYYSPVKSRKTKIRTVLKRKIPCVQTYFERYATNSNEDVILAELAVETVFSRKDLVKD